MADIDKSYTNLARNSADLCAFMIVCRHGQLSSASKAMKISQPSLSHRIKNLELALGLKLFTRTSKGVELTRDGQYLYRRIERPLTQVSERFAEFSATDKAEKVMISVDYAFASLWLLPRLPRIRDVTGAINLCILTSQDPVENAGPDTDIIIHMDHFNDSKTRENLLFQERVSAICSPAFKQSHPGITSPADLLEQSPYLLHLNSPTANTPWCNWAEWFEILGEDTNDMSKDTVFSNYELIIRAASGGQGVALGWQGLTESLLDGLTLTTLLPDVVTTECGYFIDLPQRKSSNMVEVLRAWIVNEAQSPQSDGLS